MPPLDTMMPCELLPSRSVDFSLILCGVVRDTTAREATAREAATREAAARGTTARKAAGATARGVTARIAVVRDGAGYLHIINQMKELITRAGKKAYTLVMGKSNPAKLANFPEEFSFWDILILFFLFRIAKSGY
ncbi:Diphthamide synthesis DPH1/DPH2 [Vigna unguiculata]|uniref:Diphthamide synthesis DPH1/DPH2 n=1 Tax=Vigna unguiculata TaxID=3917 RepID=A0A4D6LJ54_VIGUN|nr:Diphthamide synthesis DPH1/DPH2 [Vigna unguiculata]